MRALVLSSGGYRYCVDMGLIADRGQNVESNVSSLTWNSEELPLVHLRELLSASSGEATGEWQTVVCQFTAEDSAGTDVKKRYAVAVESIEGTEEVLVRGLGRHAALWPGIVGATELWDGTVALVLELPLLLSMAKGLG